MVGAAASLPRVVLSRLFRSGHPLTPTPLAPIQPPPQQQKQYTDKKNKIQKTDDPKNKKQKTKNADSYLYKTVVPGNPIDDVKLLVRTVSSVVRANALRSSASKSVDVSFGSKPSEQRVAA